MVTTNDYAIVVSEDDSFSQDEAPQIVEQYVCGVCHGPLYEVFVPNDRRVLVVCMEHGNVCFCGRVTNATVSIQLENGYKAYHEVIRNLSDLWGHLAETGFDYNKATMITRDNVCAVCGAILIMQMRADDPKGNRVNIVCSARHGNINLTGYIKRDKFVYDFQRIRAWEKSHRK